jgi:hypothetical protein
MAIERAYSAKPSITSGDQCQASLPGLVLLLSMEARLVRAGQANGGCKPQASCLQRLAESHTSHRGKSPANTPPLAQGVPDKVNKPSRKGGREEKTNEGPDILQVPNTLLTKEKKREGKERPKMQQRNTPPRPNPNPNPSPKKTYKSKEVLLKFHTQNKHPSQNLQVKIHAHILKVINYCRHLSCRVEGM